MRTSPSGERFQGHGRKNDQVSSFRALMPRDLPPWFCLDWRKLRFPEYSTPPADPKRDHHKNKGWHPSCQSWALGLGTKRRSMGILQRVRLWEGGGSWVKEETSRKRCVSLGILVQGVRLPTLTDRWTAESRVETSRPLSTWWTHTPPALEGLACVTGARGGSRAISP